MTNVLVLRAAGINCERELCRAFSLACASEGGGGEVDLVHVRALAADPAMLGRYGIFALPGGFSYGDDVAAGRILATELRRTLGSALRTFVDRGGLVFGVCNGFQVLVATGLLPGLPEDDGQPSATLAENASGRFVDRWTTVETLDSRCAWGGEPGTMLELPVAHGEGRFTTDPGRLARLAENRQLVFRYAADSNPNGSMDDIAGITDPTGRILGLMPHPERHVIGIQHPRWTREKRAGRPGDGLSIFLNGVRAAAAVHSS